LHIADPRSFVKRPGANGANEAYDLVLVNAPDPASGQANRFYTREFFDDCARLLSPGGALAFRLAASENVWTRFVTYRNASIYHALGGAFADVIVLPGEKNVVIASNRPLVRDPQTLSDRFLVRRVATRLVTPAYVTYLYTNDRFFAIAERMQNTLIAPNTDARPVCYRYSSMIWLSKFYPGMINRDVTGPPPGTLPVVLAVCLAAVALLLVAGRRPVWRRITVVFTAGFVGMIMESVFILYYQVKHGVLFQNIGVLLTAFMAGLSVGAAVVDRAASRRHISSAWGYGLFAAFAGLGVLFRLLLGMPLVSSLAFVSAALFVTGFLVAALFAYASLHGAPDQRGVVSPLYAADLLGGCAGSILGSLFMVPFLGMGATALLVAAASAAALLVAGGTAAPSHRAQSR
jgi:spermidine synthase